MNLIEADGLVKRFPATDGRWKYAVADVSLAVGGGEIFGLLGPNGAGKTTTLRMLCGLLTPTAGRVRIQGVDLTDDPRRAKSAIGFLTAQTGLYHRLSPRELLGFFAELHNLDPATTRRRVDALIEWLGMESFADLRCGALSTGQRQRANIARALVADPPVLILDEPTLGLDVLTNRVILAFIDHERARGKAIVLSTHYLDEAERLCDRVGLLHEGRLLTEGTLDLLRTTFGCHHLTDMFLRLAGSGNGIALPDQAGGRDGLS